MCLENNSPKICAGITVYNPEIGRLNDNIKTSLLQVERVYLIDNASINIEEIRNFKSDDVILIENDSNMGVAYALNQMCNRAIEDGYDYILTLDQDSLPEPDLIKRYMPYLNFKNVGIITPNFFDDNEKKLTFPNDEEYTFVHRCNTSASLVKLSAFKDVGGFDNKMFIDCVDFDFCTTLLEKGYKILRLNNAVLHHRLGDAKEVRFFIPFGKLFGIKKLQKPFYTYNHSPLRTYYYSRNIRYYVYKHKNFIDIKKEKAVYFQWVVLKIGFEKQKFKKIKAILKGKKDAKKMIKENIE